MQPINWQQFGLRKNPFDTFPLIEGGELELNQAFVGREEERQFLDSLFESEDRACLTILGDVGVGKTSLANFQKFIWKYRSQKLLFSFRREIEACDELLNKKYFLIEIFASILREIKLIDPTLLKHELLDRLSQLVDITQSVSISVSAGAGIADFAGNLGFGRGKAVNQPMHLSTAVLEEYFERLILFIKENEIGGRRYSGLIIHVNNFDVVLSDPPKKKGVIKFFNEIRDLLQKPDVFFLLLGPQFLFKDIVSVNDRVKSIFYPIPLKLEPLSKAEIVRAFGERMKLLKSEDVQYYINPIPDEVVYKLYDLYEGDIRSIMTAIQAILSQCSDKVTQPLSPDDSMLLLGQERWRKIEQAIKLTKEQQNILRFIIDYKRHVSQKDVVMALELAQPNVSRYYFKPLIEAGIIEEKERVGNTKYWGLTTDYIPLKWFLEAQKKSQKIIEEKTKQLSIFDNDHLKT